MGVSFTSHTFFGVVLRREDLYRPTVKRGCPHEVPDTANYCSVCGKPRQVRGADEPIDGFDPSLVDSDKPCLNGAKLWSIPLETEYVAYLKGLEVPTGSRDNPVYMSISPEIIADEMYALRLVLEPLGFWREEEFKLVCSLSVS
jgi:hypothetical protein